MTFTEYVGFYGLARSEGLVLRYLADSFKALRQTVPEAMRTEELRTSPSGSASWSARSTRQLLDEWERLTVAGRRGPGRRWCATRSRPAVTTNVRAFRVLVRNAMFRRVELAALRRHDLLGELDAEAGCDAEAWAEAMAGYWEDHDALQTGADARGPALIVITEEPGVWRVRQIFDDPAGDHDWGISADVDLAASRRRRCRSGHGHRRRPVRLTRRQQPRAFGGPDGLKQLSTPTPPRIESTSGPPLMTSAPAPPDSVSMPPLPEILSLP